MYFRFVATYIYAKQKSCTAFTQKVDLAPEHPWSQLRVQTWSQTRFGLLHPYSYISLSSATLLRL